MHPSFAYNILPPPWCVIHTPEADAEVWFISMVSRDGRSSFVQREPARPNHRVLTALSTHLRIIGLPGEAAQEARLAGKGGGGGEHVLSVVWMTVAELMSRALIL